MIKSLRVSGMLLIFCLAGLSGALAQDIKIGVVNIEGVIALSDMGKALQAKMETFMKEAEAEIQPQVEMAREMQKQLQQNAATLSATKTAEMRRKLEDASVNIKRLQNDKQQDMERMRNEGLAEIERALQPVFKKLREEDGYDLILETGSGAVLTASEKVDISKMVLERFNAAVAK